ncbi:MAG: 4Fe-4S binding protein [Candidatus Helarchaeota archaeon]
MPLTPYGKLTLDVEKCSGCGNCVDICPMLIPILDKEMKKIRLRKPETCINCKACINQCPTNALSLTPETEKAKRALEIYFEKNK